MQSCGSTPQIELCEPNPCVGLHQTVCLEVDGKPDCYCEHGYVLDEQKGCILDVEKPCDPNPCTESYRTRCHVEDGFAVCSCDAGYELSREEKCVPVTPCDPNPCKELHKTNCMVVDARAVCSCDESYLVFNGDCIRPCEMPGVCPESERAICTNDGTSAVCHCSLGFIDIDNSCVDDPCEPNPCHGEHHNTCIRQGDNASCICDPAYEYVDGKCSAVEVLPCSKDAWCRQNPLPTGEGLYGIWAFDSQNVFWVGESGVIVDYDGQELRLLDSGVGVDLFGIWGSSLGDIWVCGADGVLLHYDGVRWSQYELQEDIPKQNIRAIWGFGPQTVYACGDDGLLLFYDGSQWTQIQTNLSKDINLHSVWGAGPYDIYIASDFGKLLHWDGEAIEVELVADGAGLFHLNGTSPENIWLATMNGTLFHFDGNDWTMSDQFPFTILTSSFQDSEGVMWISGYEYISGTAVLMRKVFGQWEEVDSEPSVYYSLVTGDHIGRVFASGGTGLAMEYSQGTLSRLTHGTRRSLKAIAGDDTSLYACGSKGRLISYSNGSWKIVSNEIGDSLHSLCFNASGNATFSASRGHVYEFDGEAFSVSDIGKDAILHDVECFEDGSIMVAGMDGTCALGSDDQWNLLDTQTELSLNSTWFNSPMEGWAVGEKGLLMAYDVSGWSTIALPHPIGTDLNAVYGSGPDSVFAVGQDGVILFWNAYAWTKQPSPISDDLYGVWATAPDDAWVVGENGMILHNKGDGWYKVYSGTNNLLWDIWSDGSTGIWIVGDGGTVLHH